MCRGEMKGSRRYHSKDIIFAFCELTNRKYHNCRCDPTITGDMKWFEPLKYTQGTK